MGHAKQQRSEVLPTGFTAQCTRWIRKHSLFLQVFAYIERKPSRRSGDVWTEYPLTPRVEVVDPRCEVFGRATAVAVLIAFGQIVIEGVDPCGEIGRRGRAVAVDIGQA